MDKIWDLTIEYLAKVNNWIPLVAVLFAGLGLIGVVLILAITGCALRKRLVPNWLIWTYFAFATIIIFAHTGNNLAAVVEAMEVPVLVVLVCYILRTLFYRRPRYTYVREEVYARELAKGRVVKNETAVAADSQNSAREIEVLNQDEKIIATEKNEEKVADVKEEIVLPENKIETKADEAENDLAATFATVEKEEVKAVEPVTKRIDKNDFFTARSTATTTPAQTVTTPTIDLPVVEPIPDKSYQPVREPLISTTPISERIPDLKMASAFNRTTTTTRPVSTTTTSTARPTTTFNRPATTSTATASSNAFSSMYGPRVIKTTTTTTTTTNPNSSSSTVNTTRTVNGNTTNSTTTTTTTPHSTQDIMAAIERLRASMKK